MSYTEHLLVAETGTEAGSQYAVLTFEPTQQPPGLAQTSPTTSSETENPITHVPGLRCYLSSRLLSGIRNVRPLRRRPRSWHAPEPMVCSLNLAFNPLIVSVRIV